MGREQGIFCAEGVSIQNVCERLCAKNNAAIAPLTTHKTKKKATGYRGPQALSLTGGYIYEISIPVETNPDWDLVLSFRFDQFRPQRNRQTRPAPPVDEILQFRPVRLDGRCDAANCFP